MAFLIVPEYAEFNPIGACVFCRVEKRPGVRIVDLGIDMDVTTDEAGQPVIRNSPAQMCEVCAKEIAHMLGWVTDDVFEQMTAMSAEIESLRTKVAGYEELDRAVRRLPVG